MSEPDLKFIYLGSNIRLQVPASWGAASQQVNDVWLTTPDGGRLRISREDIAEPDAVGSVVGIPPEELIAATVEPFGARVETLLPDIAFATHTLAAQEAEEVHVWHVAARVAPWHYQLVLIQYDPSPGRAPDPTVVAEADRAARGCDFASHVGKWLEPTEIPMPPAKPWWKFWG